MRKNIIIVAVILLGITISNINAQNLTFKTKMDSLSYVIGYNIGSTFKRDSLFFNLDFVKQGMKDMVYDEESAIDKETAAQLLMDFQNELMAKYDARKSVEEQKLIEERIIKGEENYAKAQLFLEENKSKPGVITTESGLQYKILEEGKGPKPTPQNKVKVHYKGSLLDGKEFDSSYERGEPIEFELNGLIAAWQEGIPLMKVGSKAIFWVKPELGYAEKGAGDSIGPNELLIFEIELLQITR